MCIVKLDRNCGTTRMRLPIAKARDSRLKMVLARWQQENWKALFLTIRSRSSLRCFGVFSRVYVIFSNGTELTVELM